MSDSKHRGCEKSARNSNNLPKEPISRSESTDANVTFAPGIFDPDFRFGEGLKDPRYLLKPLKGRKRQTLYYSRLIDEFFHGCRVEGADSFFESVKGLRVLLNQHHSALVSFAVNRLSASETISFVQQSFHSLHVFFYLGLHFGFKEGSSVAAEELDQFLAKVKELNEKESDAPPEGS